jgi:hypothetical protein
MIAKQSGAMPAQLVEILASTAQKLSRFEAVEDASAEPAARCRRKMPA